MLEHVSWVAQVEGQEAHLCIDWLHKLSGSWGQVGHQQVKPGCYDVFSTPFYAAENENSEGVDDFP